MSCTTLSDCAGIDMVSWSMWPSPRAIPAIDASRTCIGLHRSTTLWMLILTSMIRHTSLLESVSEKLFFLVSRDREHAFAINKVSVLG